MTKITDNQVVHEEARNQVVIQTGGSTRLSVDGAGGVQVGGANDKFGVLGATPVAAQATTATTGAFTASTGTSAVSGSSWVGNVGTKSYSVSDIVTALKNYGILAS